MHETAKEHSSLFCLLLKNNIITRHAHAHTLNPAFVEFLHGYIREYVCEEPLGKICHYVALYEI